MDVLLVKPDYFTRVHLDNPAGGVYHFPSKMFKSFLAKGRPLLIVGAFCLIWAIYLVSPGRGF